MNAVIERELMAASEYVRSRETICDMKPIEELVISPWPWKNHGVEHGSLGFVRVRDQYGFFVADAEGESDDNANANGDIIAAAPELYECLREAVKEKCESCKASWYGKCVTPDGKDCEVIAKWRVALAKAGGTE